MSRRPVRTGWAAATAAVATFALLGLAGPAQAAAPAAPAAPAGVAAADTASQSDDLPNPREDKRRALRTQAIQDVLAGTARPEQRNGSTVVKVGRTPRPGTAAGRVAPQGADQYVELRRERTDRIFVILAEFGNVRHPSYPDQDTSAAFPGPVTWEGPLHNEIPQPDRAVDNSTVWQADYNADHYRRLYFGTGAGDESLKQYYEKQSTGRYSVDGVVSDWVKVPYNEARYGRSNGFPCGGNVCSNTWFLIRDAVDSWVATRLAAGQTQEQIAAELAHFDEWDRYDHDNDGNFTEPDGYIDHFQIVHSGGDQADGDPWQGEDAIWSHRWKAFQGNTTGPAGNLDGGSQIGTTGLWVADYTIQPENGGRSVFYHEYAHDLGLPDDYDTSGGGDSPNEHWTLMAQSRLGAKDEPYIGDRGGDLGAWNKLQLGWLDYLTLPNGVPRTVTLGPLESRSQRHQALVVPLTPKKEVRTDLGAPAAGTQQWYSGTGHNLSNTLTRDVALPSGAPAAVTFQARYDIEDCGATPCDYAYVEVGTGGTWTAVPGSITNAGEGNGIDGTSSGWVAAMFDLSAYAGQTIGLRLRYQTDGAAAGNDATRPDGLFIDELAVTSGATVVFSDGAETEQPGWTATGWSRTGATTSAFFDHYYIASWRTYVFYDRYLKTGPYYFGYANTKPDQVDHYSYQEGLLVSYWDTSQSDNNVNVHPGAGRNLYVDARPDTLYRLDGQPWRTRIQMYDAPFSPWRADSFTLHHLSRPMNVSGAPGRPLFDDTADYFDEALPNHGVKLPALGVKIRVVQPQGTSVRIRVS